MWIWELAIGSVRAQADGNFIVESVSPGHHSQRRNSQIWLWWKKEKADPQLPYTMTLVNCKMMPAKSARKATAKHPEG